MKTYERQFELDSTVRRLQNGDKLRLIFKIPYNHSIEKELVNLDIRRKDVKIRLTDLKDSIILDGLIFEVFDLKVKRLANGDKLVMYFENLYTKETDVKIVNYRFDDVNLFFEIIEEDLFQEVE